MKYLLTLLLLLPLVSFGQTNPFFITGTSTARGDLLVATSSSRLISLPLGAEGSILQSLGGFLSWVASTTLPYVPYTGATGDVDLGANKLTTTNASTTNLSVATDTYLSSLGSAFLSVNQSGKIIATTTPVITESDPVWLSEKASYLLSSAFNGLFDTRLNATTSLPSLTTLKGLTSFGTLGATTTAEGHLKVVGNTTVADLFYVNEYISGNSEVGGDLTVSGHTSLQTASSTNLSTSGNLNVGGTLTSTGEVVSTLSGNANFRAVLTTNPAVMQRIDGSNYYFLLTDPGDPYGSWNSLRPITISTSDGKVGIGTATMSDQLTVNGVGRFGTPNVSEVRIGASVNVAGHEGVSLHHDGSAGFINSVDAGTAWHPFTVNALNFKLGLNGATDNFIFTAPGNLGVSGDLDLLQLAANSLTLNGSLVASGNVGIGTTSPVSKLSVLLPGQAGTPSLLTLANTGNWAADRGVALDLDIPRGSGGAVTGGRITAAGDTSTNQSAYLSFSTRNTSGVLGEKMRITQDGRVGIGTSTPAAKLEINTSSASEANQLVLHNPSNGATASQALIFNYGTLYTQGAKIVQGFNNGTYLALTAGVTEGLRILANGNVTMTNASTTNLTVSGTGYLTALGSTFLAVDQTGKIIATTTPNSLWTQSGSNIHFNTGNVGIGVVPSTNRLQVEGGNFQWNALSGDHTFQLTDADGNTLFLANAQTSRVGIKSNPSYEFDVTGKGRFTTELYVGNKLGIGTTSPNYALEVIGLSDEVARFHNAQLAYSCTIIGATGILECDSDLRLKKNITTLDDNLSKINALNPVAYNWLKEGDEKTKTLGFIAQEVEKILPNLVTTNKDTGYKGLSTINMIPLIVGSIKEISAKFSTGLTATRTFTDPETGQLNTVKIKDGLITSWTQD